MAKAAGFHLPRLEIIVAVCSSQTLEDLAEKLVKQGSCTGKVRALHGCLCETRCSLPNPMCLINSPKTESRLTPCKKEMGGGCTR